MCTIESYEIFPLRRYLNDVNVYKLVVHFQNKSWEESYVIGFVGGCKPLKTFESSKTNKKIARWGSPTESD